MTKYHSITHLVTIATILISVSLCKKFNDETENGIEGYLNAQCNVSELKIRTELKKETQHTINAIQDDYVIERDNLLWTIKEQYQLKCSFEKLNKTKDQSSIGLHFRFATFK